MKKILLVDDHPVVTQMMSYVIKHSFPDFSTVVADSAAAMRNVLTSDPDRHFNFELAIIDLGLPDEDGLSLIPELRTQYKIPVMVLTGRNNPRTVNVCRDYDAAGFVAKVSKIDELVTAMKIVLLGGHYFPSVKTEMGSCLDNLEALSWRQKQVLKYVVLGRSNKYIAIELGITEGYVRNTVSALFDLFSVAGRSRSHLAAIVTKLGYQPNDEKPMPRPPVIPPINNRV